jgi:hypothetical protein
MPRSTTRVIRTAALASNEQLAPILLRLMMAVNDISLANAALKEWDETEDPRKRARKDGGKLYYGRMQMGHIYEALLIIKDIKERPSLRGYVDRCDPRTIASFARVEAFLDSPDYRVALRLRNNAAFHYDDTLALRYLKNIRDRFPDHSSLYSLGSEQLDWYFEIGDLVLDTIVVRDIFRLNDRNELRGPIETVLDRLFQMAVAFMDFAGHFLRHYV